MRGTFMLDKMSKEAIQELPGKMNASKIARWVLKVAISDTIEIEKLLKTDSEFKQVQDYFRPRLQDFFNIDETKRKKIVKIGKKVGL